MELLSFMFNPAVAKAVDNTIQCNTSSSSSSSPEVVVGLLKLWGVEVKGLSVSAVSRQSRTGKDLFYFPCHWFGCCHEITGCTEQGTEGERVACGLG